MNLFNKFSFDFYNYFVKKVKNEISVMVFLYYVVFFVVGNCCFFRKIFVEIM